MADYFCDGMRLYLGPLVDWETILGRKRGESVDLEAEIGAFTTILETAGGLASGLEDASRENWGAEAELTPDGGAQPPEHIRAAYETLRENGLVCMPISEAYGGFGLPIALNAMVLEMISRADTSLMTVVGLQTGAAGDIEKYGTEEVKAEWLPRFTSGEVQGCMDLTEPHAGSDLGRITTRATEEADGRIRVDGTKIFITNGGAEVHLVLARDDDSYDASKGTTNGLSLVLVPRHGPDGSANGVRVSRLERKLGIHGSPTCEVVFEAAMGVRLGEKGQGFRAMLELMNNARLGVAAQALGLAEAAFHDANAYAQEREQFGKPIAEQPLVRAMLAKMAVNIEAVRALLYSTYVIADANVAREAALSRPDLPEAERAELQEELERDTVRMRLRTPLCKYFATEICSDLTRDAMQVFGGIGFTMDADVAKLHADSLIMTVYEGTSEIQASFALREMGKGALGVAFGEVRQYLEAMTDAPRAPLAARVLESMGLIEKAAQILFSDINYALFRAKLMAEMVIVVLSAMELLRQVEYDPKRIAIAEAFVIRRCLEVETSFRRIEDNHEGRVERDVSVLEVAG